MTNRMLINATQAEEVRVAIVNGSVLDNLDTEIQGKEQQKANIYKAKITRIEPSLEAVFVDYGGERHGFLPFREIANIYHKIATPEESADLVVNTAQATEDTVASTSESTDDATASAPKNEPTRNKRPSLRDRFTEGQEIIIQVEKEARGNKGAALTTYISLAGCYLVLMPLNPSAGGISRRIDSDERAELREVLQQLNIPEGMGVIVRTAGVGRDIKDLQWDLDFLVQQWHAIEKAGGERTAPFLIYQESNVVVRAIRDHLRPEINEILVDSPKVYEDVNTYVRMMRPDYINRVKLYNDSIPLFSRFQIESQIENAMQREVRLPSGGSIVIDHTEALISIDINSAKATRGGDIEETALQTNLEAAEAIARQLRLRDIGGLIVIDFIDMGSTRNQRAVEQKLKEAMSVDRARVQIGKISSRFGLLEMSRQRLRPSLASARDIVCPRCLGQGTIRGVEVLAINMIRLIEEEAIKDGTAQVIVEVPSEVATYLINEKRQTIIDIERKHHIRVIILPSQHLETPNFVITRTKRDEIGTNQDEPASYTLASKPELPKNVYNNPAQAYKPSVQAAVSNINTNMAPQRKGIIKRLLTTILGNDAPKASDSAPKSVHTPHTHSHSHNRSHSGSTHHNNQNRNRGGRSQQRNRGPRPNGQQRQNQGQNPQYQAQNQSTAHASKQHDTTRQEAPRQAEIVVQEQVRQSAPVQHERSPAQHYVQEVSTVQIEVGAVNTENDAANNTGEQKPRNQQQRRRKQNRRRNHYRKNQGGHNKSETTENSESVAVSAMSVSDTKVDE